VSRESLVGKLFAGYSIHSLVGEGGTSTVYRATHPQSGVVAIKVLREKLRHDKTAVARFVREATYGTRGSHPNVVRTIEIGEAGPGLHFLAIEWATGEILDRYTRQIGPLGRGEVAEIILQIAQAVHAAHAAGIVHRDLKPENVMYDPATRQVKLLDFGIATETDAQTENRLTRAGFFVGTLMYIAPEALSGEIVTPAADQYSLATIAYNLLTCTLPYQGRTPRELFTQLLSQPPIPLNKAKRGLDFGPHVEAVVGRALLRDPQKRYPDTLIFAQELQSALLNPDGAKEGISSRLKGLFRPRR